MHDSEKSVRRKDLCLIVPTIRNFECLRAYYANARKYGFDLSRIHTLFITEDSCDRTGMNNLLKAEGVSGEVFTSTDRIRWIRHRGIDEYADLIPRRSHAESSFGLLYMQAHPSFAYGIFIDDDTRPSPRQDFFGTHLRNLSHDGPLPSVRSTTRWVNVLHPTFFRHRLYPRGYPYSAMGERTTVRSTRIRNVVCSQGLWTDVPDLDAVRILAQGDPHGQSKIRLQESDYTGTFAVSPGNYATICSMNLAFRREILPVFYQLPMDDNPWKIGRFDDIWSGVFLQRAAHLLGKNIVSGYPLCRHAKAPRSTFKDLLSEAPALAINEHLWSLLHGVPYTGKSFSELYLQFARTLQTTPLDAPHADFLPYLAQKMRRWVSCLRALSRS